MATNLITHCGARVVTPAELAVVETPPPTDTWFPVSHSRVLDTTVERLGEAGFAVQRQQLALTRDNARFFGTLDLKSPIVTGVSLAVGIRNSIDKSLPIAFCAGSRVFVCDNLAFRSEIVVARKHTRNGQIRFVEALSLAIGTLSQFQEKERERIKFAQHHEITDETAESIMLRSFERGIVSHRFLPRVLKEWRQPGIQDFEPRTLWSLEQCFTGVLDDVRKTNPQRFAALTIQLQDLLAGPEVRPVSEVVLAQGA